MEDCAALAAMNFGKRATTTKPMTAAFLTDLSLSRDTFADSIDKDKVCKISLDENSMTEIKHQLAVYVIDCTNIAQP